jgi:hypothetical protein
MNKTSRFRLLVSVLLSLVIITVAYALSDPPRAIDQLDLRVHEWGTFTSIAGEKGEAVSWRPFGGPTDLPCFVDRFRFRNFKGGILGTVRMETPVLYFYASQDSTASVKVLFPKNVITEWYPKATVSRTNDAIEWRDVRILPNAAAEFPAEPGQSHYYAARETDAAPLQVGSQKEKFLFYRGVGTFALPISVKAEADGRILVKNLRADEVSGLILFENRGGKLRYQVAGTLRNEVLLDRGSQQASLRPLEMDLERILVSQGLYPKEAQAMIETWRDSWFEEGTRLFYVVPQHVIDSVLPLNIQPAPAQIARVFVGRMELITPFIEEDVRQAIAKNDRPTLEKYGRFLQPIAMRIGTKSALLDSIYSSYVERASSCN